MVLRTAPQLAGSTGRAGAYGGVRPHPRCSESSRIGCEGPSQLSKEQATEDRSHNLVLPNLLHPHPGTLRLAFSLSCVCVRGDRFDQNTYACIQF